MEASMCMFMLDAECIDILSGTDTATQAFFFLRT